MRRVALFLVLAALGTGACSTSAKTVAPAPKVTTTEPVLTTDASTTSSTRAASEQDAWIAAASDGALANNAEGLSISKTQAACLGRALITTVTVAKLKAAGVTFDTLRDPNTGLPPELGRSLTTAQKVALGGAVQRCGFGATFGRALAEKITQGFANGYKVPADSYACIGTALSGDSHSLLMGNMVLATRPAAADATALMSVVVDCIAWGPVFGAQFRLTLSAAELACINTKARNDANFIDGLAGELTGDATASVKLRLFGVSLTSCLTAAHLKALARANQSNE